MPPEDPSRMQPEQYEDLLRRASMDALLRAVDALRKTPAMVDPDLRGHRKNSERPDEETGAPPVAG